MKKILLSTRTIVLTLILMFFIAIACFDFGIKVGAKKITRSEKLLTSKESVRRLNASQYLAFVQISCFTDGGSFAYTFLNQTGEAIHLWQDHSIGTTGSPYKYYIKAHFNETDPVEVERGSEMEKQIIELLKESPASSQKILSGGHTFETMCDALIEGLETRKEYGIRKLEEK